jgi:hypothetical protein
MYIDRASALIPEKKSEKSGKPHACYIQAALPVGDGGGQAGSVAKINGEAWRLFRRQVGRR